MPKILVLNSGSSSQKSALFELDADSSIEARSPLWEGKLQWDGESEELHIRNHSGQEIRRQRKAGEHGAAVTAMLQTLWSGPTAVRRSPDEVVSIGHRIVHGGHKLAEPVRITAEVKREIEAVRAIAPLHNEAGLEGVEIAEKLFPGVPQVAVFDTGFHRTLPPKAFIYPGPYSWYEREGIRRFGFHGINHQYCAHRAAEMLGRDLSSLKIITCHLGNGCSLCAIDGGESVDTSMGFTPLEGLMMGTRSGSIDPGILLHLFRNGWNGQSLDRTLNRQSGLLGVSGVASDMREVLQAVRSGNQRAKLAFDIFVHRLQKEIGAMATSLGGVDALVFTAGIGENSAEVRKAACDKLAFVHLTLDPEKNSNAKGDVEISSAESRVRVLVISAQEDWAIARECVKMVASGALQ